MSSKKCTGWACLSLIAVGWAILIAGGCSKHNTEEEVAVARSIYKTEEYERRLMAIYDLRLAEWPGSHESLFVDTAYGTVHVVASGPEDGPAILLFHASELAAWSWLPNIRALNERYRTYAIDHIGEAGKSVLNDTDVFPKDGDSIATLYLEGRPGRTGRRRSTGAFCSSSRSEPNPGVDPALLPPAPPLLDRRVSFFL